VKAHVLRLLTAAGLAVGLAVGISASAPPLASARRSALRIAPMQDECAVMPHDCGFPDTATVGVPAWMSLRRVPGQVSSGPGWYYDPRGWVEVDGNGAVLSGLDISHSLDISASNVTIKDVNIQTSGRSSFGISLRNTSNVTIENSDIEGDNTGAGRLMVGIKDIFGNSTGTAVLNNNISRVSTGVQVYEGLIQNNYIHDMGYISGDHVNGITVSGGTTPLTIQHNTILVDNGQTDAISLFQDTGVEANKVIKDNLLAGGGYAIYGGNKVGAPAATNIVIEDNRFSTIYYPGGGQWGPVIYYAPAPGNVWSGNVWNSTDLAIPSPSP
jgi:hypothetical protein